MKKFKILVFGIGGVGGYFGGLLAKAYHQESLVEVIFVARGEHLKQIKENGLQLKTPASTITVFPDIATDDPTTLGEVDLIWLCTKSYQLSESLQQLKSNIGQDTFILPLLNGANIHKLIESELPRANVLQGCVYVNAYKTAPGEITQKSEVQKMVFGKNDPTAYEIQTLDKLDVILAKTDIKTIYAKDVLKEIWTKYIFISATSAISCLTDKTFGEFRSNSENMKVVVLLMLETIALARVMGITISENILEKHLQLIDKFPKNTITSMQLDMRNNRKTEVETMVCFVPSESKKYHLKASKSEEVFRLLASKLAI